MTQITQQTIATIHALLDAGLVAGLGSPEPGKMCVEAVINYALGRKHGCEQEPTAANAREAQKAVYAAEQVLITFAENVVQILIDMRAPGCQWLEVAA